MLMTSLSQASIGSVLAEPILVDDVLLCKAGTVITKQLKESLPRFGIKDVVIDDSRDELLNEELLDIQSLTPATFRAIVQLDLSDVISCAKMLVRNAVKHSDVPMLNLLLEYDECTYQHSINVANFAVTVGLKIGLSKENLYDLALGSLLHDVGKLNVPLDILNKPAKLNDMEYEFIKQHPLFGLKLLENEATINSSVKQIVLQHHENYDGSGYPRQLTGTHSFRLARLVHICDVYEALCAKRPYKDAMPRRVVRQVMLEGSCKLFDPILLSLFLYYIPLYFQGETITVNGRTAIVQSIEDKLNPIVYCDGSLSPLAELENIDNYTIDKELLKF